MPTDDKPIVVGSLAALNALMETEVLDQLGDLIKDCCSWEFDEQDGNVVTVRLIWDTDRFLWLVSERYAIPLDELRRGIK